MNFNIPNSVFQPAPDGSKKFLLVVLHGRGDSPAGYLSFQEELNIPNLNVLLLQAPDEYYGGYSWYAMPPNQEPGILRSRKLLTEVFAEIERAGFSADQCILFGFSQGCLMTLEFGSRYPKLLKGYVGVSGYCFNVEALLKEAQPFVLQQGKWLINHGTEDDVLPVETTRAQMKELMARGFKMDYREYKKAHTISEDELSELRSWIINLLTS